MTIIVWPATIGGGHVGYWGGKNIDIVRVQPDVSVEVAEHGRWRHVTSFIQPRPDLRPGDTTWPR